MNGQFLLSFFLSSDLIIKSASINKDFQKSSKTLNFVGKAELHTNNTICDQAEKMCFQFEKFMNIVNPSDPFMIENLIETMKYNSYSFDTNPLNKIIHMGDYNHKNTIYNFVTKIIFYCYGCICTFYLNEEELKNFLYGNIFEEKFVVPEKIIFSTDMKGETSLFATISERYKNIYSQPTGYRRNIYLIYDLLEGLYTLSCVPHSYIENNTIKYGGKQNFSGKQDFHELFFDSQREIILMNKLRNFDFKADYMTAAKYFSIKIYRKAVYKKIKEGS